MGVGWSVYMRTPLDSTQHKDSGKDFDGIYQNYYDPRERIKRMIQKRRQEREQLKRQEVGL